MSKTPQTPPTPKSPPPPRRPPSQPPTPRQNPRPLPPSPSNSDDLMALAEIAGVAVSDFVLPDTRLPLVFAEGRRRLVGAVRLGDGPPRPGNPPPPPPQPFPPNPFPRP